MRAAAFWRAFLLGAEVIILFTPLGLENTHVGGEDPVGQVEILEFLFQGSEVEGVLVFFLSGGRV